MERKIPVLHNIEGWFYSNFKESCRFFFRFVSSFFFSLFSFHFISPYFPHYSHRTNPIQGLRKINELVFLLKGLLTLKPPKPVWWMWYGFLFFTRFLFLWPNYKSKNPLQPSINKLLRVFSFSVNIKKEIIFILCFGRKK